MIDLQIELREKPGNGNENIKLRNLIHVDMTLAWLVKHNKFLINHKIIKIYLRLLKIY